MGGEEWEVAVRFLDFDMKHAGLGLSSARGSRFNQSERRGSSFNTNQSGAGVSTNQNGAERHATRGTADAIKGGAFIYRHFI